MKLSAVFLLIGLAIGASAVDFTCSIVNRVKSFADGQSFYDCNVISGELTKRDQQNVNDITAHWPTRGRIMGPKIKSFTITNRVSRYMPHHVDKFLSDIVCVEVSKAELSEIKHDDLQQFPKLMYLNLSENKLKKLESNLFKNNPDLEVILLNNNQISRVDSGTFNNLENLHSLNFNENSCHTLAVRNSLSGAKTFVQEIYNNC